MNVLIINLDKAVFNQYSASLWRLEDYSQLVDKLFVVVWTRDRQKSIGIGGKLFIYPTNSRSKILYFLDTFRIVGEIIKKERIDLIITQDPFETGLAGWWLARKYNIPLQLQIHTDFGSPYFWRESIGNKLRYLVSKFLITRAAYFRVVSQRIKNTLIKFGISQNKISVLPVWVEMENKSRALPKFDLRQKYLTPGPVILTAGRLVRVKNIALQIEAMKEVVKTYPAAALVVVGEGSQKSNLVQKARKFGLEKNVIFAGYQEDMVSHYKTSDVFVMSSNYEGTSMSMLEAMAAGAPVVMTDVSGTDEILKNEESGIIVPQNDVQALARAILRILGDKILAQNLGRSAAEAVVALDDKTAHLEKFKEILERSVGTNS